LLDTRTEGRRHVWLTIKEACNVDAATAEVLLDAAEIKVGNGCISLCYDARGQSYVVPIACINDPINFGTDYHVEKLRSKAEPTESSLMTVIGSSYITG
jgi:hypothetical protein